MNSVQIKEKLEQAFPPVPAGYDDKINAVLHSLDAQPFRQRRAKKTRLKFTVGKIVAASLAFMIIGSGCAFVARPALAANIPVVNEIVYALSPTVEPDEEIQNRITEAVQEVLSGFISNATSKVGVRFKSGDNWALNEDTLLAAYYLHFEAASAELVNDGKTPALANIAVKSIEAEQKGFRYTATLTYDILLDKEYYATETVIVRLEENINGLYITSLDIKSDGFEAYKGYISQYDRAEYGDGTLDENIIHYNAFLIGRQRALNEKEKYQTTAPGTEMTQYEQDRIDNIRELIEQVKKANYRTESEREERLKQLEDELAQFIALRTPRNRQLEAIASELCYRFWSAANEMPDMSDIMERNDDTELWFLAVQLRLEQISHNLITPSVMVEKGYAEILEIIDESNGLITVKVYVKTIIDGGIGQTIQLTFKPVGDTYRIVFFASPWDDGLCRVLKDLADEYVKKGISHAEANAKAYEALYEEMTD